MKGAVTLKMKIETGDKEGKSGEEMRSEKQTRKEEEK